MRSLRPAHVLTFIAFVLISHSKAQSPSPSSIQIPVGLEVCEAACLNGNGDVGTWIFHGLNGKGVWAKSGAKSNLTIEQYDAERILIRRENTPDSTMPAFTAIYEGTLRGRRIDGTVTAGHPPRTIKYQWYATIPVTTCDSASQSDTEDVFETGQKAVRFRQAPSAFQCFLMAAKGGNGQAKALVGLMYRDGIGTTSNLTEAFRWLQAGAIQDDYNAQVGLSQMYDSGIGASADPQKAQMWRERAQNNPVIIQQRQQAQQQAAQQQAAQQMMFLGLAAVVEAMSKPDVYVVY